MRIPTRGTRVPYAAVPTMIDSAGHGTGAAPARQAVVQPVILAGGSGTRIWPLSPEQHPKQLLNLVAENTLLEATARRLEGVALMADRPAGIEAPQIVVCGEEHRFMIAALMKRSGKPVQILAEPCARNTAPALTMAALHAMANAGEAGDAVLVATPADHAVLDPEAFRAALAIAVRHADQGAIVTLGVRPSGPETGFGYIRTGNLLQEGALPLERFVEKPHLELARAYVESGDYWWNSGVYVVRASVWLRALAELQPEILRQCRAAYAERAANGDALCLCKEAFEACPSDSIDYAVMEKIETLPDVRAMLVPMDPGWSDVGSWAAIWDIAEKDAFGNVARGRVVFDGASSCLAHLDDRLVACVGVRDVVVVRGTARVTCGETVSMLPENQSTYIPIGTLHRIENPGKAPLKIIELQSGAYPGEDDVVRFEDNYGRK